MNSEKTVYTIHALTLGYSDSEDRLWMRLLLNNHPDVQHWITRRFVLRWHKALAEALFDTVTVGQAPAEQRGEVCAALEYHEALSGDSPPGSNLPSATINTSNVSNGPPPLLYGVLNYMQITARAGGFTLLLSNREGEEYRFEADRYAAYRLLFVLKEQIQNSMWEVVPDDNIRSNWCADSFLQKYATR